MFPSHDGCRKLLKPNTATVNNMQSMPQQCPPWTLHAWPPLLWQVGRALPSGLRHLYTQVTYAGDPVYGTAGQTMWGNSSAQGEVGLAWDWMQLEGGVLAMADPMAVITNLRLVGHAGQMLTSYEAAQHYCAMVHALPWQQVVEWAVDQAIEQALAQQAALPGPAQSSQLAA